MLDGSTSNMHAAQVNRTCDAQAHPVVMLVDDDPTTLAMLDAMLKQEGLACVRAATLQQAQALARERACQLAVLDVHLPDGNGLDLCRWLKRQPQCSDMPILMLSAENDVRTKVAGFEAGAIDYVTKPFHRAEVMARVRTHLRLHAAFRAVIELQALKLAQVASAQQAMMPNPAKISDAKFHLYYKPLQEAGGDFCFVAPVGPGVHDYIVADVCGHHVGTAMTTAALQALFRQNCSSLYSPREILATVNRVACSLVAEGQYLTAVYARLNRHTRRLSVVSAGHPPAIVQRADGSATALWQQGDVIGAFESAEFDITETSVTPGDRFFLFSDALVEGGLAAKGATDWQAGIGNLIHALRQTAAMDIAAAVDAVVDHLFKQTPASDDIAIVGVTV